MAERILNQLRPPPLYFKRIFDDDDKDYRRVHGAVEIHTHGSCLGNHDHGDRLGGVGVYFRNGSPLNYSARIPVNFNDETVTNNRAEATAILAAIRIVQEFTTQRNILLFTNSTYMETAVNNLDKWQAAGFRQCLKHGGGDAENPDLLQAIWELKQKLDTLECQYVAREDSSRLENAASLAKSGSSMRPEEITMRTILMIEQQFLSSVHHKLTDLLELVNSHQDEIEKVFDRLTDMHTQ